MRRSKRKRAIRERTGEVARNRELPQLGQFPAAQAAIDWHLREIVGLQELGLAGNPPATTNLGSHLDAVINITRRFVTADPGFCARIRQSDESGNGYPLALVELLERVDAAAIMAKGSLYQHGGIDRPLFAQMEQLRQLPESLIPPENLG